MMKIKIAVALRIGFSPVIKFRATVKGKPLPGWDAGHTFGFILQGEFREVEFPDYRKRAYDFHVPVKIQNIRPFIPNKTIVGRQYREAHQEVDVVIFPDFIYIPQKPTEYPPPSIIRTHY